ncbi:hypothetical protein OIU84_012576 [Salix udensis]|uniref:Uncharacterized protein n=1 Tax=Salix udensis TaxID=889485 RepID=A0AAD6JFX2_9ROSI|nr:hypothetical protein OIU84_012576 [Salix udensis]
MIIASYNSCQFRDPDQEEEPETTDPNERIILINPLTQGMVVIEGAASLESLLRDMGNKNGQPPIHGNCPVCRRNRDSNENPSTDFSTSSPSATDHETESSVFMMCKSLHGSSREGKLVLNNINREKHRPENWNWSMGTLEEDKHEADEEYCSGKTYGNCLWSIPVSMAGGLLLLWWGYEHHPTNTQLWMVPFGLILFLTPLIAWVALVGSGTCTCEVEDDESKTNDLVV